MSRLFPDYTPVWETDDHRLLREHAATFLAREATPNQERWAEQHAVDRDFWTKAGAAGLLCLDIPDEYGGGGGDFGHEAVVAHERSMAHDTAFGFEVHSTIVSHYVAAYGSEDVKRRYLPQLVSGEKVIGIAMTEPDTGSDLQAVRTTARREGDHYLINGSKTFISNATHADLMVIVAKTDTSLGARGISLFLAEVSDDTPGFSRGRVLHKIGQHGQDTRELAFEDLRVPADHLLGLEGEGFFQLMNQLPRERLILGVNGVAMAEAAVTEAIRYAKVRQAFGRPILDFQNTRFVLAECKTDVLAGRAFIDHCVQCAIDGTLDAATASMAKLKGTDLQVEVVDRCLQVFGGYGYLMEYPIAQMYAAARVQKIYGGTNEIMKELIGRSL
jgi:acyl-CoA dehydrogenase